MLFIYEKIIKVAKGYTPFSLPHRNSCSEWNNMFLFLLCYCFIILSYISHVRECPLFCQQTFYILTSYIFSWNFFLIINFPIFSHFYMFISSEIITSLFLGFADETHKYSSLFWWMPNFAGETFCPKDV